MSNIVSPSRGSLFRPLVIREMALSNRVVMAPMTRGRSPDGVPGEDVAAYYRRRAENECGLIITEAIAVDHPAASGDAGLDERDIPLLAGVAPLTGWRNVVEQVHGCGGRIVAQLWHPGVLRKEMTGRYPDVPSVSPSGYWGLRGELTAFTSDLIPPNLRVGRPMTEIDIEEATQAFVRCASNAIQVGFDGIALHGAHGYLIDNFLWEGTNQRNDRWGGDLARRGAFAADLVRGVRAAIGEAYPIFFRFSQWKQQDFRAVLANSPTELADLLCPLADAGVDVFDASVRYFNRAAFEGSPLTLAGWAKNVTGKCSMAVGGIGMSQGVYDRAKANVAVDNIDFLLMRLEAGEFDLAAVGRAMLGDPSWARKTRLGERVRSYQTTDLGKLT